MDQVAGAVAPLGLADDRLERLKTAVSETAMNGNEHGSGGDADVPIHVRVASTATRLRVRVADMGLGGEVPLGTAEIPDIEAKLAGEQKPRGWGLFLIEAMVDEVAVANRAVMDATWSAASQREGIWRLKGVVHMEEAHLPALTALWEWRESEAKRRDLPPGRLLHPEKLMAIARRSPGSPNQLRSLLRGRNAGYLDEIFETLERAARKPPPVPPRPQGERMTPGESRRLKRLKQWRREEAERRQVPQPVVLPPKAMNYLARHGDRDLAAVPQFGDKRARLYAEVLSDLCG